MALDTLKLRSPYLAEGLAQTIERQLTTRLAIDGPTNELLWSLTSGQLEGSFDSRISVEVKREEWISTPSLIPGRPVSTALRECAPYLMVEGSVHKALLGHNVYGGPDDLYASARWFTAHLGLQLGVELPDGADWLVRKVDWAEIFRLVENNPTEAFEAAQEYIGGLVHATYPRRDNVSRYGTTGLLAPGFTSAIKVYHKGPEFGKHDRRRLRAILSVSELANLQEEANTLLRVEVSIKARKLDADFGHPPTVREVGEAYLVMVYQREIARLLREGKAAMETVRTANEVRNRLSSMYRPRLANVLYATWVTLSTLGEEAARKHMPRATFYDHRGYLEKAAISWHATDVQIVSRSSLVPTGFSPVRTDLRRVAGEAPKVVELLAPFRRREDAA